MHPLTCRELGSRFEMARAAENGLLPSIYFSDDPVGDLDAYVGSYLQQEIVAESATRNVPAFSRFLKVAALCNGTIVNFTKVANDSQVPRTTIYEYFDILKDTLLLHEVPSWKESRKRKPVASSKYYFFDVGVVSALQGRQFRYGAPEFGEALETLTFQELIAGDSVKHWRTRSGFKVDFILGDHTAVEVKAGRNISSSDLKPMRALAEENNLKNYIFVCQEDHPRKVGNVSILPFAHFIDSLWGGEFI